MLILALSVLVLGGFVGQALASPAITKLSVRTSAPGSVVAIGGTGFGDHQMNGDPPPTGSVTFGGVPVTDIRQWSDTSIVVTVPNVIPGSQPVVVSTASGNSNAQPFNAIDPWISITAAPLVITPTSGKPLAINLAVFEQDCDNKKGVDLTQGNSPYTLVISGNGFTLASTSIAGRCSVSSMLNVDPTIQPGTYQITLQDKNKKSVGSAQITVMDVSAGPIPPGLPPQVDVMWEVMSQKNCSDAFGARVAQADYCIDLKIGNDSGYALQVAGIGFANKLDNDPNSSPVVIANSSYASTRAVLLTSMFTNGRNIAYNILQATGVLMAGFTPYFGTGHHPNGTVNNARLNWTTAASIVSGPLLSAFNIVAPNPVIAQLNNLDDQSFRDNRVIPNNTHMQTVVFVEKQALTYQLNNLSDRYPNLKISSNATESNGVGPDSSRQTGANSQDSYSKLYNATVKNSTNSRRMISTSRGDFSPLLVKLALGSVVIVGDQIAYLNRVQIQSSAAPPQASAPLSALPSSIGFANQSLLNSSPSQSIILTNTGSSALTNINPQITSNATDFSIASNTCSSSLGASANCVVTVVFTPFPTVAAPVSRKGTLQVSYTPSSAPVSIQLSGTVLVPTDAVVSTPSPLNFGSVTKGSAAPSLTLTIANFKSVPLTGLSISDPTGANRTEFVPSANTCGTTAAPVVLAVGQNCSVTYTFTPGAAGTGRTATVTFSYQVAGVPQPVQTVTLVGAGQ